MMVLDFSACHHVTAASADVLSEVELIQGRIMFEVLGMVSDRYIEVALFSLGGTALCSIHVVFLQRT